MVLIKKFEIRFAFLYKLFEGRNSRPRASYHLPIGVPSFLIHHILMEKNVIAVSLSERNHSAF